MGKKAYSFENSVKMLNDGKYTIVIAMSGGGTRAAALSYGVLKALHEQAHPVVQHSNLLDEVDVMSAVSGGSFTAAYYGLYGERIFSDYEKDFLYHDVGGDLTTHFFNPFLWFSTQGLTEKAVGYYQRNLFGDATFADLQREGSPLIILNASDLGNGVRFSFLQEYFDFVCSDLLEYPVANAVTASSAVPVLFNPIVLKNYDTCEIDDSFLMRDLEALPPITRDTLKGLASYGNKEQRKYIHLVDGGITDNLGLLSLYDIADLGNGKMEFLEQTKDQILPHYVIISIDASAKPETDLESSPLAPGITETISAMTDVQLHRFNATTYGLIEKWREDYTAMTSKMMGIGVETYLININLSELAVKNEEKHRLLNNIPTSFSLESEEIDALIKEGETQLQNHPDFIRFLSNISEQANYHSKSH
ncbi:patatin-like phospholipase family protein [Vibrio hannami]|uniref:patatin-like phospholipase family protein n=1 Tax=Vibrio hannami TaxID=2717094 RepID=UPI00240F885B|nr:patatin-like phospholipase family protein [Vibrio hannami]MDG3086799.1 patatin-like phospholipase family protein [Vibrio hannami]